MKTSETKKLVIILGAVALGFAIFGLVLGLVFKKEKPVDNRQYFFFRAGKDEANVETTVLLEVVDEKVTYAIFSENFKDFGKKDVVDMIDKEAIISIMNVIRDEDIFYGSDMSLEISSNVQSRAEEFRSLVAEFRDNYFSDMKFTFNITSDSGKFHVMVDEDKNVSALDVKSEEEFKNVLLARRNVVLANDLEATIDFTLGVNVIEIDCNNNSLKLVGTLRFASDVEKLVIKNAKDVDLSGLQFDDLGVTERAEKYTLVEVLSASENVKFPDIAEGSTTSTNKGLFRETVEDKTTIFLVK